LAAALVELGCDVRIAPHVVEVAKFEKQLSVIPAFLDCLGQQDHGALGERGIASSSRQPRIG
jgi:hypothetical protein